MTKPAFDVVDSAKGVSSADAERVLALDSASSAVDGAAALDDQVRIDLADADTSARHMIARSHNEGDIVGYGHADVRSDDEVSAHLVVAPSHRRRGVGSALLGALSLVADQRPLRVWAHGNTSAAQAMAARRGFEPTRELRQMRLAHDVPLPQPSYPPDVVVRAFVPGDDDEAWVAVNAAAFFAHPEQGRLGVGDLRLRVARPWFDPAGFFLAERAGRMLGYHWTKVHPSGGVGGTPIGEVYVLGVHPDAQRIGLGRALTLTGLHHLRDRGMDEVMLYVESDNLPAVVVYERLGFRTVSVDVMYARR